MIPHTPRSDIAANRARYEEHQRKGLTLAPKALPDASPRPLPPLDPARVLHLETIPGDWYWTTRLRRGEALRIAQTGAHAAVAMVCWRAEDPSERLCLPDTVKVQWTTTIRKGRALFSESGRVLLSVIEDTSGAHDVLAGGSAPGGNEATFPARRTTRENLTLAAMKFGLTKRDLPMALTLFAPVRVSDKGTLGWDGTSARGDDAVDLRAEMDLFVALSTCAHPLDPAQGSAPVTVTRYRAPYPGPDDPCRTASAEAQRGFSNTIEALK